MAPHSATFVTSASCRPQRHGTLLFMTYPTLAGWYPDPGGSAGQRWWDGGAWTEHVQLPGQATAWQSDHARQHLGQAATSATETSQPRSPLTEQRMFVSQKRKIIELTNEYAVFGADGVQIGAVTQIGQSAGKKALRFMTGWDQFMTHTVQINDAVGRTVLVLTRPAKVFKSTMIVTRPDGAEIGRLIQRNVFGKIRFGMEVAGHEIGSLNAENWRAWNFAILDHQGTEVARITKTWEGLMTTLFTTADNYLVDIHRPIADPMRCLVVAAALTVDTALKQDARGLN